MDHGTGDGGSELVLDNRKLVVAFALLVLVCGVFFVLGFIEGKRQGQLVGAGKASENTPVSREGDSASRKAETSAAEGGVRPLGDRSVQEQLDWYKSLGKGGEGSASRLPPPGPAASKAPSVRPGDQVSQASVGRALPKDGTPSLADSQIPPPKPNYAVQVGAFRYRKEVEAKAAILKAKGYAYVIEPPRPSSELFLLKVGKFDSRAEAVAMQLRLRRDGFTTFIKTN